VSILEGQVSSIYVVDDEETIAHSLGVILSREGFDVSCFTNPLEALDSIQSSAPDLLISDVMMPQLDGYELLAQLRETPETRELPVILLSARAGEEAAIEGLEAGADDYLPKPFSGRELLARVRAHVDLSELRRQTAAEVRAERGRLEQTLRQLPVGVMLAEAPSRRVLLGNEQATEILGHGILPHVSEGEYDDYRLFTRDGVRIGRDEGPLARAIRLGDVTVDEDMLYESAGGRLITVRVSAGPIRDEAGEIVAGVLVFQDVSERVRSERLLTAQRDILALIAGGQPLSDTLEAIVSTVETLSGSGARASVQLVSADGRHLVHGAAPSLPAAYNRAVDGIEIAPSAGSGATTAHRGEEVVVADTLSDPRWADQRDLVAEHGLRACWSVPIRADDGGLVGTFAIYYDEPREPAREDRRVVDLLSQTAGVAIGRARDAENRARRLAELQSSLLPRALPEVPGIAVAVSFHPADRGLEVGGDFYDLFPLPHGAWGFVIGDVCGHGAEAAAVTALTRHTTRAIARMEESPARVLDLVNQELRASDHERFCTAQYGRLEPVPNGFRLTLACGGHPPPLIRRGSGKVEAMRSHGPLLGVFADARFPEARVLLHPDDMLLLYTDGLIERNPRVDGEGALRSLLGDLPRTDVDGLLADLEARALGSPPARLLDDAAVLVMQVSAAVPEAIAPESVRAAA
jgi:DNA-binding response OmpR family regulator/serine phosphatase RsbU (regulator of sigma subunit)